MKLNSFILVLLVSQISGAFVCLTSPEHPEVVYIFDGLDEVEKYRIDPEKHKPLFSDSKRTKFNYDLNYGMFNYRSPHTRLQKWDADEDWPRNADERTGMYQDMETRVVLGAYFITKREGYFRAITTTNYELYAPTTSGHLPGNSDQVPDMIVTSVKNLIFNGATVKTIYYNHCGND